MCLYYQLKMQVVCLNLDGSWLAGGAQKCSILLETAGLMCTPLLKLSDGSELDAEKMGLGLHP